ncbi:hypothetical protein Pint_23710 [Pistacia integerrima]|uniref:Uncharacterized protein n=1 Tax=Pistacia integerrima TaxID=434235 RepID=A0ACC0YMI5_9ROSI|nr:hypothetical protein Pint_23710 [Pistacia integerrima]
MLWQLHLEGQSWFDNCISNCQIVCRYKMGDMGVQQAEPRLEPKKHRRQSRKKIKQSILDELDEDEDEDDDDDELDLENDPILRAMRNESQ